MSEGRGASVTEYREAFATLLKWLQKEDFRGYDPYDGCSSKWRVLRSHRALRLLLTYGNKWCPVNVRPMLGVEKRENYCALALINYSVRRCLALEDAQPIIDRNIHVIRAASLIGQYGEHCWNGNGLYIQSRSGYQTPWMAGVIGTVFCGQALLEEFVARRQEIHRDVIVSIRRFLLTQLLAEHNGKPFFRYRPSTSATRFTFNASIKAALFLAEVDRELGFTDLAGLPRACAEHVLDYQRADGAWLMNVDLRTGRQKDQIDFHQGFIVDAILRFIELEEPSERLRNAYEAGIAFYRRQFHPDGSAFYRYPRRWPSNIHDQAQGIISFAKAARYYAGAGEDAHRIATWTLKHMRDPKGYFYYLSYPLFKNRIPYIRWGQAWILYALAQLLSINGPEV